MTPTEAWGFLAELVAATDEGTVTVPPKAHRILAESVQVLKDSLEE